MADRGTEGAGARRRLIVAALKVPAHGDDRAEAQTSRGAWDFSPRDRAPAFQSRDSIPLARQLVPLIVQYVQTLLRLRVLFAQRGDALHVGRLTGGGEVGFELRQARFLRGDLV